MKIRQDGLCESLNNFNIDFGPIQNCIHIPKVWKSTFSQVLSFMQFWQNMTFLFLDWSTCRAHSDLKSGVQKYAKQTFGTFGTLKILYGLLILTQSHFHIAKYNLWHSFPISLYIHEPHTKNRAPSSYKLYKSFVEFTVAKHISALFLLQNVCFKKK